MDSHSDDHHNCNLNKTVPVVRSSPKQCRFSREATEVRPGRPLHHQKIPSTQTSFQQPSPHRCVTQNSKPVDLRSTHGSAVADPMKLHLEQAQHHICEITGRSDAPAALTPRLSSRNSKFSDVSKRSPGCFVQRRGETTVLIGISMADVQKRCKKLHGVSTTLGSVALQISHLQKKRGTEATSEGRVSDTRVNQ